MGFLLDAKVSVGHAFSRMLLPRHFTIISDDCWGGQFYRHLKTAYTTPTVGLWIDSHTYVDFVANLRAPDACELSFLTTDNPFPVAKTPYTTVYFMHYASEAEARDKWLRRFQRINFSRVLVKIDLGKPDCTEEDVEKWNSARLPNSVAFYPATDLFKSRPVSNGVQVPDWVRDGAEMFEITRKYFDIFWWVRTGAIRRYPHYRLLNALILDPTFPRRAVNLIRGRRGSDGTRSRTSI